METTKRLGNEREASQAGKRAAASKASESIIDQILRLFSSVRFGIIMMMLVLLCCMTGMFIMQENVQGFRAYYQSLSPAQRSIYSTLGLFDIYHAWYFTLLLGITALNIILSSIDRFPAAWAYIRKPRVTASPRFIRAQMFNSETEVDEAPDSLAEKLAEGWRKRGLRSHISKNEAAITVFAQRNVWNRLGAYVVHLALITIFVGGFLTSRYSMGGQMEIAPGESSRAFLVFNESEMSGGQPRQAELPFTVECTDLRQELIRPEGGLDVMNTIDWLSYIRITDEGKELQALVHLNSPFDYRGYRFFQSSFEPQGYARQVTIKLEPANGGPAREVAIERNGIVDVEGIGRIEYVNFYPDFTMEKGRPATETGDYNNPAAEIRLTSEGGKTTRAFALSAEADRSSADHAHKLQPAAGTGDYKLSLLGFEKVATSHTLTVQYDPGRIPVYVGFTLLLVALCGVFFSSHQRVWAVIEPSGKESKVYFGGNTNRNRPAFESRFNLLVRSAIKGSSNNE
jgi:cytochrome c biogenesis protein